MVNKIKELLREERAKYPQFTEWQLYARVRARIMCDYGQTETAQQLHIELKFLESNVRF